MTRTVRYGAFTLVMCSVRGELLLSVTEEQAFGQLLFTIHSDGTIADEEFARLIVTMTRLTRQWEAAAIAGSLILRKLMTKAQQA
jgi:hypothetical protein